MAFLLAGAELGEILGPVLGSGLEGLVGQAVISNLVPSSVSSALEKHAPEVVASKPQQQAKGALRQYAGDLARSHLQPIVTDSVTRVINKGFSAI